MNAPNRADVSTALRLGISRTVAAEIAGLVQARLNCIKSGNDWRYKHEANLNWIADHLLPSGSGIDSGTAIDWGKSTDDKLVMYAPFHHMNDGGGYAGWTEHTITVRPDWTGVRITISGRDRNNIKEYLYQTFEWALTRRIHQVYDPVKDASTYELEEQ